MATCNDCKCRLKSGIDGQTVCKVWLVSIKLTDPACNAIEREGKNG